MNMKWADKARVRMKERGLIQEDLKACLGVDTRGAVGHYFSGRRQLKPEQMRSLAEKLGFSSLDELFGSTGNLSATTEDVMSNPKQTEINKALTEHDVPEHMLETILTMLSSTPKKNDKD